MKTRKRPNFKTISNGPGLRLGDRTEVPKVTFKEGGVSYACQIWVEALVSVVIGEEKKVQSSYQRVSWKLDNNRGACMIQKKRIGIGMGIRSMGSLHHMP